MVRPADQATNDDRFERLTDASDCPLVHVADQATNDDRVPAPRGYVGRPLVHGAHHARRYGPQSVFMATRYWERSTPDDPRMTIEPSIRAPLSSADYFAGRDPVLDAILKARPPG